MSTPTLATAGGALLDIGYAGQPANLEECSIFTLDNESTTGGLESAGTIDFGIAVARGTNAGCCKIISADADLPIGITVRHPVMVTGSGGKSFNLDKIKGDLKEKDCDYVLDNAKSLL